MPAPTARNLPPPPAARAVLLAAAALLVLAILVAYSNSLGVPFLLDDASAILRNATLHHLWPLDRVLAPPPDSTVAGRPLVNLSLALNYAFGGTGVTGYHALNLAIHAGAGLLLFGVVRRTFLLPRLSARFGTDALPLALVAAALWLLHPLQTISVTYVSQRSEALMGLCYLLTLYAFVRRVSSAQPGGWDLLAVTACLLGAASKETIATAPLLVLLYDRTFVAGSFSEAWRRHRRLYVGLAASWLLLAGLMSGLQQRGAGFGLGVSWQTYALTECEAVARYVGLAVWPHPLVFDYGPQMTPATPALLPYAIALILLLGGTLGALRSRPMLGFFGCWFFLILAPTSSVVPIALQPIAENRVYLPLAAITTLATVGFYLLAGRRGLIAGAVLILALGSLTLRRNHDYRSEIALLTDTVGKRPANARARYNLGFALSQAGRDAEAQPQYLAALQLQPIYPEAHNNLGNTLSHLGRPTEAIAHYAEALRLRPDYANAHFNLGCTLAEAGRLPEAITRFEAALRIEPGAVEVHYHLGNALVQLGRPAEAIPHYEEAVRLDPLHAETFINLGSAFLRVGRQSEALTQYETALRLSPHSPAAHYNLANIHLELGRLPEAITHYEEALQLQPDMAGAHHNLALALVRVGRPAEAIPHYERTLQLMPDSPQAHHNLALALARLGRVTEAIQQDKAALQLQPDYPEARSHLAELNRK